MMGWLFEMSRTTVFEDTVKQIRTFACLEKQNWAMCSTHEYQKSKIYILSIWRLVAYTQGEILDFCMF